MSTVNARVRRENPDLADMNLAEARLNAGAARLQSLMAQRAEEEEEITMVFGRKKCNKNQYRSPRRARTVDPVTGVVTRAAGGRCRNRASRPCKNSDWRRSPKTLKCRPWPPMLKLEDLQRLAILNSISFTKKNKNGEPGKTPLNMRNLKTRLSKAGVRYPGATLRVPF
jgi:hypothetical protein